MAVGDLPRRDAAGAPATGAIDDLFVHADYDHVSGRGRLRVDVPGVVAGWRCRSWGGGAGGETVELERVEAWSAELPRLYACTVTSAGERSRCGSASGAS